LYEARTMNLFLQKV